MIASNDSSGPPAEEPVRFPPLALRRRSRDMRGRARRGEPARYALHALADALALFFPVVLAVTRGRLSPAADVIALLAAMVVIALAGGLVPALVWVTVAALVLCFPGIPRSGAFFAGIGPGVVSVLLAAVALAVSFLGFRAARRSRRAARTAAETARRIAEADRMRAVLLATLGHDLRGPLAAAKAAVSGLRSPDVSLTADDSSELLSAADESLDRLAHITASLLDMSRLQAGKLSVFPRPAALGDIVVRAVDDVGLRSVTVCLPAGLPEVMADPELMERVIENLARNALQYSPPGTSPPLLTARAYGARVELRVIDRGPGIPRAERNRAFLPFQRLGDTSTSTGVGLGLALSRGLTEAMGDTLDQHETPGGGLTMVISLPAARRAERAGVSELIGMEPSG
jgi:two-component system, OmpR family, sensor histidine kinase KdpD